MKPFRVFQVSLAAILSAVLMVPLILMAQPLWVLSILTRKASRLLEPSFVSHEQLIEFDPVFGWRPRANVDTHHLMGDLFHIKTDADGWRGCAKLSESDMVVIGDSFAAGYGVGERAFFAHRNSRPRIKAMGAGGYSLVQELLLIEQLASELQGKLVVWFVYLGNDLYDNLSPDLQGYRKPFAREGSQKGSWEIVSDHVNETQWPIATRVRLEGQHHLGKLAEICSDSFLAKRAYDACEFLIRSGQEVSLGVGASLAVMTIPEVSQLSPGGASLKAHGHNLRGFDPQLPDKRLAAICRTLGIPFLAGQSFLDENCYMHNDCHWTALGHRRVATALAELYSSWKVARTGPTIRDERRLSPIGAFGTASAPS